MLFFDGQSLFLTLFFFSHGSSIGPFPGHHPLKGLIPPGYPCARVSPAPCVSCLGHLLFVGPVFLKLVARSHPKPSHSQSAVKNVPTWDPLSPAVTPWLHLYSLHAAACREGRKSFLESTGKADPYVLFQFLYIYPLFQVMSCEVGLEVIGFGEMAERHHRGRKDLWDGLWVVWSCVSMWVYDLQVLAAEPSHLYDVWNAASWKIITFPQTSTQSWVRQKAEISVPEMELHCVRSLL